MPFDEEQPPESIGDSGRQALGGVSSYSESVARSSDLRPLAFEEMLPTATIAQFIQGLLSLDPILRDIVAWQYKGLPYKEIAERQGTSTQLAEMRHKRALREWPALADLFPVKTAKRARRKSRS